MSLSNEDKNKKAIKLYRQLFHESKDQLVKLLNDSGCDDQVFLKMIVDCDSCKFRLKFKKPFSRQVIKIDSTSMSVWT